MKARVGLILGIACFFTALAPSAKAQDASSVPDGYLPQSISRRDAAPSLARGRSDFPTVIHAWISDLEKAGIVNRALPAPYRVAVPLASFGDGGPTLMMTYARSMPGNINGQGFLLFVYIKTP